MESGKGPISLEDIQGMWKRDSVIDDVMLDNASLKIPQLHQKYLTLHSEFKLLTKKKSQELKRLHHNKWLYYSGKASPEVYEDAPFPHKVIKSDIQNWVGVDKEVNRIEMQLEYYYEIVDVLSEILKQIHQMSFNIKNAISWRSFVNGGGVV